VGYDEDAELFILEILLEDGDEIELFITDEGTLYWEYFGDEYFQTEWQFYEPAGLYGTYYLDGDFFTDDWFEFEFHLYPDEDGFFYGLWYNGEEYYWFEYIFTEDGILIYSYYDDETGFELLILENGNLFREEYEAEYIAYKEDLRLSAVLYNFAFILDGDIMTLPLTLDEVMSYGWEPFFTLVETINANTMSGTNLFRDDLRVRLGLGNFGREEIPLGESLVYSISSSIEDEDHAVIELPKGIVLGVSTMDDVLEAFGYPTLLYFWDDETVFEYQNKAFGGGIWNSILIVFYGEDNIVSEIEISNRR
jgi:hypothetical protein